MTINLEAILNKKQETKQSGERFLFESVGDQLVFKFLSRRTVKTARGDDSDLVEVEALGGTKLDKKSKQSVPVQPGKYVFFVSTVLRRIFDDERPIAGDIIHVSLTEIVREKNNMKLFGFEYIERIERPAKPSRPSP